MVLPLWYRWYDTARAAGIMRRVILRGVAAWGHYWEARYLDEFQTVRAWFGHWHAILLETREQAPTLSTHNQPRRHDPAMTLHDPAMTGALRGRRLRQRA